MLTMRGGLPCGFNVRGHGGRFRARRGQLKRVERRLPESQGQNLAWTVLYVPYTLDSGMLGMHILKDGTLLVRGSWKAQYALNPES
jgi:hypothetical protein